MALTARNEGGGIKDELREPKADFFGLNGGLDANGVRMWDAEDDCAAFRSRFRKVGKRRGIERKYYDAGNYSENFGRLDAEGKFIRAARRERRRPFSASIWRLGAGLAAALRGAGGSRDHGAGD